MDWIGSLQVPAFPEHVAFLRFLAGLLFYK
jgi:hypothetical protein